MKIAKDCVAEIEYTLTNDNGDVLDSSDGQGPLTYLHGHKNLVPGLETELEGKQSGDTFKVSVSPENGYGQRNEEFVTETPKETLAHLPELKVGMQLQSQSEHGTQVLTIAKITDTNVVLDANHPLAGTNLNFDVTIKTIREATSEELKHGHAHGPGGHNH